MAIVCPYCTHRLNLRAPKPGRFRPKCPNCDQPFVLIVPEKAGSAIQVRPAAANTPVVPGSGPAARIAAQPFAFNDVPDSEHLDHSGQVAVAEGPGSGDNLNSKPWTNAAPAGSPQQQAEEEFITPKAVVRGYKVERELGRGGMGAVYLARQLSLDRPVALKVMSKRWATDPVFVARFTREAYAAAQLSHPNIVHIHDIGEVDNTRFFSMEYVRGRSLADLVKVKGKLDPETAVGYVLQAARGLKHAHDRGMIHRDVKPDNLLLDDQGLVKVADLGLVKTPSTRRSDDRLGSNASSGLDSIPNDMTGARIALGTPAYMSPEQCRDAATVDHRADIYSLGCTLYVLVTGRPPFEGTTAIELMTKHAYDPLVPPEQIAGRVPKEVSAVIQRMMAKQAHDRFQTMDEVIRTLESWLGVHHAGTFSPQEEQIAKLESHLRQFNSAPTVVLRTRFLAGFFGTLALAAVLITFFGKLVWAFGLFGLAVQGIAAYFVLDGLARRGQLFTRTRQFMFGLTWGDWAVGGASLVLSGVLLAMLNVFWIWCGFGIIGVGLAFALRYSLDRKAGHERHVSVQAGERLLRRLRMQGLDEEEVRQFVAKFSGRDWEEYFEALFGYDAKLTARALLLRGGSAGVRNKHAAWREPLLGMIDRIETVRREGRERKLLQAVELANLLATGASADAAGNQARVSAEAMVKAAGRVREAEEQRARVGVANAAAPVNVRRAVIAGEEAPFAFVSTPRDPFGAIFGFVVGAHTRAIAAAILLAGCALWAHQNGLVPGAGAQASATQALESQDLTALGETAKATFSKATQPLAVAGVPPAAINFFDGWNSGLAGLLLLGSLFYRGNVMAVFTLIGAGIAAVGHQYGIRTVEPFRAEYVALMLGAVLTLVGFRSARS